MPRELPDWLELYPAPNRNPSETPASQPEPSQTENLLPFDTMSSNSTPISPQMFAMAIKDLPVDTLYAKAAELQNSMSHLRDSNAQMKQFADEGDEVCKEAIAENDVVISRTQERIQLCKAEVEGRGLVWTGHADKSEVNGDADGVVNGDAAQGGDATAGNSSRASSGRLTDEELRRQLESQLEDDGDDGVHL